MKSEHVKTLTTKALDDLAAALEAGKSDTLERFLTIAGRFPRYSFRNVMLIATQRPDATQVAGFNTWKALGRFVKKGEKGIVIIAPMRFRRDDPEPPAAVEGVVPDCGMRFKAVYVFDVSQTDGEPLGDISQVTGDPGRSIEQLKAAIAARGITLEYSAELGTAEGRSSGGRIELTPGLAAAHEFEVLAHELAHEILHHAGERRPRRVEELEAEAVAFAVCTAVGLEAKTAAADYIQLYQGNPAMLAASLERIQEAAAAILTAFETEDTAPAS